MGVSLFVWALSLALSPNNRGALQQLMSAGRTALAGVCLLTAVSIALNGLCFWVTLRPIRRLSVVDVVAVNAIATLLGFLPFKLSLMARMAIHRSRDGLGFKLIAAWLVAWATLSMAVIAPLAAASAWRQHIDFRWMIAAVGGMAGLLCGAVFGARLVERHPRLNVLSLGSAEMLRSAPVALGHAFFRALDVAVQTGRFLIVTRALGHPIGVEHAMLLATTYFMAGILSPAGNLGSREGAVSGLGYFTSAVGLAPGEIAQAALVLTAVEALTALVLAIPAAARLRPDRLFRNPAPSSPGPPE